MMLRKAVEMNLEIARPLLYGDGQLLTRLSERGSSSTQAIMRYIRAGKRAFYLPAFVVMTGADATLLSSIQFWRMREHESPRALERELVKATGLAEGQIIVTFGHDPAGPAPVLPHLPVQREDGSLVDFFEISPLGRAVALEQQPKIMFSVHCPPSEIERVRLSVRSVLMPLRS
jgi:hypothetical protein